MGAVIALVRMWIGGAEGALGLTVEAAVASFFTG